MYAQHWQAILREDILHPVVHSQVINCSPSWQAQQVTTNDYSTPQLLPISPYLSRSCPPQTAWPAGFCTEANGSNKCCQCQSDSKLCPPLTVTTLWKNVLELGDEFLQLLDLSGAQVQLHIRYHMINFLTTVLMSSDAGIPDRLTGTMHVTSSKWPKKVPPGTWSWSLIFTIRAGTFCRGRTSIQAMQNLPLWKIFMSDSMRPAIHHLQQTY
jgi:hypothetical protein